MIETLPRVSVDTSKIDRMDVRQRIDAHEGERTKIAAELKAARASFNARIEAIQRERMEATAAIQARLDAHDETPDIYDDVLELDDSEDFNPIRCCITGLILLDGDELVEDAHGRRALAAAVNWPDPPQDLPDAEEDDEDEDDEEEKVA